jgi:hypothetical protein
MVRHNRGVDPRIGKITVGVFAAMIAVGAAVYLAGRGSQLELGPVVWRGDFETGDLSQWQRQSACTGEGLTVADVGNTCITVVREPRREGAHAARFRLDPHSADASTAARAELYLTPTRTGSFEGREWFYGWSTFLPSEGNDGWWSDGGDWNFITQFHNADGDCGASLGIGIDATSREPHLYLELIRQRWRECGDDILVRKYILEPLRLDHWYDFALRVRWSSDPQRGEVELWLDGKRVVKRTQWPTMHDQRGAYWKQGFYRGATGATNTVIHDNARRTSVGD